MKKLLLLFAIASFAFASCSKDSDEPEKGDPIDSILGTWTVTAHRLRGDQLFTHFADGEYFEFKGDKTCVHYDALKQTNKYTYTYDPTTKIIKFTDADNWGFSIIVEFTDDDHAIFDESSIIKMVTRSK